MAKSKKRPAIVHALVTGAAEIIHNVYAFTAEELATLMADRQMNGLAHPEERAVRFLVTDYNIHRRKAKLPDIG